MARLGLAGGGAEELGPATHWPACLRRTGLRPLAPSAGGDLQHVDEFLYRLHGMYLAVLTARYARTRSGGLGQGEALFPRRPAPGGRGGYPWQDLCGPLPQLSAENSTQHIVRGSAQHTMHSTNRQRVRHPVHGREQHVVHSAQRATRKAQADRCPCAKAARPRCFLWAP